MLGGNVRGFGDLEAVIMHLVWDHAAPGVTPYVEPGVTVRELFDELRQERTIAYTTVMSTMDNLHRKGWLVRAKEGKAYRYAATASREEYSARLMSEALAGGGDTEAVLNHFVAQMDGDDSELLRAVVRRLAESG
jgi:predicted transcriptional regulator